MIWSQHTEIGTTVLNIAPSSVAASFPVLSVKHPQTHGRACWSYPVALEARAELRDSLAFTSMMQYSIEVG